jgi:hypothetical protein
MTTVGKNVNQIPDIEILWNALKYSEYEKKTN